MRTLFLSLMVSIVLLASETAVAGDTGRDYERPRVQEIIGTGGDDDSDESEIIGTGGDDDNGGSEIIGTGGDESNGGTSFPGAFAERFAGWWLRVFGIGPAIP